MNNDLISRSALKEKTKSFIDCDGFNPVWQIIDEAPTVDAISNDEGYEMYGKGYLQGYKRGKAEAIPKGEWEEDSGNIACSHCHTIWLYRYTDFCPNCGAKMQKEGKKE